MLINDFKFPEAYSSILLAEIKFYEAVFNYKHISIHRINVQNLGLFMTHVYIKN